MYAKYFHIARLAMIHGLKNYKALAGLSVFLLTCLVIFAHLWKVVATKAFFPPDQLLWYIALNEWILVSLPEICYEMEEDLHSGRLAYLLPRPISYLGAKFAEGVGTLLLNMLLLGSVAFLFTWLWSGTFPFSPLAFGWVLLTGVAAGVVGLLFQLSIGLSSFWLRSVEPFYWVFEKLLFVFGGLILPLTAYPIWMQKIASWTPFPAILGQRSALVLTFEPLFDLLLTLALWLIVGTALALFLFRQGLKIVTVEGG